MLRIDLNLLWTVINVLIIFYIVKRFLLKPIQRVIAARQEEIEKQYADAKAAEENAKQIEVQARAVQLNGEQQKNAMLKEARVMAEEEYQRIVEVARTEADRILADAKILADREQEKCIQQARDQIRDLVVAAAAKLVASKADEESDRALYNQFIAKSGGLER